MQRHARQRRQTPDRSMWLLHLDHAQELRTHRRKSGRTLGSVSKNRAEQDLFYIDTNNVECVQQGVSAFDPQRALVPHDVVSRPCSRPGQVADSDLCRLPVLHARSCPTDHHFEECVRLAMDIGLTTLPDEDIEKHLSSRLCRCMEARSTVSIDDGGNKSKRRGRRHPAGGSYLPWRPVGPEEITRRST